MLLLAPMASVVLVKIFFSTPEIGDILQLMSMPLIFSGVDQAMRLSPYTKDLMGVPHLIKYNSNLLLKKFTATR